MTKTRTLTMTALMTAFICIFAPISIPIPVSPVALTLGTFAMYLTAYVLPPRQALAAIGLYLLLGAAGLPVFSGYTAGLSRFAAPGGGYLIGFLFLTGISSLFISRFPKNIPAQMGGLFLATIINYMLGTAWMAYLTNTTFLQSLPMGALVFLPLDIVKSSSPACWATASVHIFICKQKRENSETKGVLSFFTVQATVPH